MAEEKILIVDDSEDNLFILSARLKNAGYAVVAARDGVEGLKKAKKEQPDLILLDILMPKMDGYETCKRLKRDERTEFIPVIMLTAKTELDDVVKGLEIGADDYITKPFQASALIARVNAHLRRTEAHRDLYRSKIEISDELKRTREALNRAVRIEDDIELQYEFCQQRLENHKPCIQNEKYTLPLGVLLIKQFISAFDATPSGMHRNLYVPLLIQASKEYLRTILDNREWHQYCQPAPLNTLGDLQDLFLDLLHAYENIYHTYLYSFITMDLANGYGVSATTDILLKSTMGRVTTLLAQTPIATAETGDPSPKQSADDRTRYQPPPSETVSLLSTLQLLKAQLLGFGYVDRASDLEVTPDENDEQQTAKITTNCDHCLFRQPCRILGGQRRTLERGSFCLATAHWNAMLKNRLHMDCDYFIEHLDDTHSNASITLYGALPR